MNKTAKLMAAMAIVIANSVATPVLALTLEEGFANPPRSARPHTWYHMMNGNVTKEGITCDFEAIAKAGLGGVQMFDAGCNVPAGPMKFNSPEWFDLFRHAASEARRLGLEICIPNCSGWSSSGGPWVAPSNGMKVVVFTETPVAGGARFNGVLPREKNDHGYYEDIAVLAMPVPPAETLSLPAIRTTLGENSATVEADEPFTCSSVSFQLEYPFCWSADGKVTVESSMDGKTFTPVEKFEICFARSGIRDLSLRLHSLPKPVTAKALRLTVGWPIRFANGKFGIRAFSPETKRRVENLAAKIFMMRDEAMSAGGCSTPDQVVDRNSLVDLTGRTGRDGSLDWTAPAGRDWRILRIGCLCTGRMNHPASEHGRGLEVDKFSASAMDFHFSQYVTRLCETLGPLAGRVETGFNNILVDSYEVGAQNWTQRLDEIFEKRRGYSLRPFLPVFAGYVVGSVEETDRFLEDFRRVVADLFAENYSGRLAELCHRHGLMFSLEPYGSCPADNLQYGESADIPMSEFWSAAGLSNHRAGAANSRFVSHIAHVWGRRYVGAEAFTGNPPDGGRWATTPFAIKAQGDRAYAMGVNRIIYHRFTHQPWPGNRYLPGMTMGRWGMHLDRTQTWWQYAGEFFRYQARCQWMLQEGSFVADALFFCGEEAPNQGGNTDGNLKTSKYELPYGYAWDVCSTKAMMMLQVRDGKVVTPGGATYPLLVLPERETMSPEMLGNVERLLDAGAKICAVRRPVRSLGLRGYPAVDERVRALADRVWAKGVMECTAVEALRRLGIAPDFASDCPDLAKETFAIHRRDATADWYFVACNNDRHRTFEMSFRETGRIPELWDPMTGEIKHAPVWRIENGRTFVTFDFEESGSAFVVFRKATAATASVEREIRHPEYSATPVDGAWRVAFPTDWYTGGKTVKTLEMNELRDWTILEDDDLRHFSGTAVYEKTIAIPPCADGKRVVLDLGTVKNFAKVTANGREYPVLWKPPFRLDVTDAAKGGEMKLSIRVTNLWPNRLIGDDALPPDVEWVGSESAKGTEQGVKEIPDWVKRGLRSPTGRHTFTTWRHWKRDEPLLPSGILGPVSVLIEK